MKTRLSLLLFVFFLIAFPASADLLVVGDFEFDNPLKNPEVQKIGPDAYSCTWPVGAAYKEAEMEMIVASFGAESVKMMKEGGGKPSLAALSTYMGLMVKPRGINKTLFMGKGGARKVYDSSVPRKHEAHVFGAYLPDGGYVQVGIRLFGKKNSGGLIRAIANTFRQRAEESEAE